MLFRSTIYNKNSEVRDVMDNGGTDIVNTVESTFGPGSAASNATKAFIDKITESENAREGHTPPPAGIKGTDYQVYNRDSSDNNNPPVPDQSDFIPTANTWTPSQESGQGVKIPEAPQAESVKPEPVVAPAQAQVPQTESVAKEAEATRQSLADEYIQEGYTTNRETALIMADQKIEEAQKYEPAAQQQSGSGMDFKPEFNMNDKVVNEGVKIPEAPQAESVKPEPVVAPAQAQVPQTESVAKEAEATRQSLADEYIQEGYTTNRETALIMADQKIEEAQKYEPAAQQQSGSGMDFKPEFNMNDKVVNEGVKIPEVPSREVDSEAGDKGGSSTRN